MGANTALIDVCELAQVIIAAAKDKSDVEPQLRACEAKMIPRGRTKVLESRAITESDKSLDVSGGRLEQSKSDEI